MIYAVGRSCCGCGGIRYRVFGVECVIIIHLLFKHRQDSSSFFAAAFVEKRDKPADTVIADYSIILAELSEYQRKVFQYAVTDGITEFRRKLTQVVKMEGETGVIFGKHLSGHMLDIYILSLSRFGSPDFLSI